MKDLVVVILLNYNQNEYTLKCVDSLLKSDYKNFRVFLIDNGSTKKNADQLAQELPKDNRLIYKQIENNIGYGKGSNYGMAEGMKLNPGYFLMMNNDTIIDDKAISELVKTSQDYHDRALVTGKVYHYDEPDKLQFVGFKSVKKKSLAFVRMGLDEVDNGQYDKVVESDMIDDIFVLHSAHVYRKVGGYSPYFWINGVNIDRALRAMDEGFKLIYTPKAKLWHKGSVSIGGREMNPKIAFWSIQSRLMIRYLHLNKRSFIFYYLRIFFNDISRTYIKSQYLKIFKGVDNSQYAEAKLKGLLYFNKWVFVKNENTGYSP